MERRKLTKEIVAEIARQYGSRWEFQTKDKSAYGFAQREGLVDELCAHMRAPLEEWTKDRAREIAQKFSTRSDFQKANPSVYQAARRNRWLEEICYHMMRRTSSVSKECATELAKTCRTRTEFKLKHGTAYSVSRQEGWLDEICLHMERGSKGFDPDKAGYLYQIEFQLPNGFRVWKVGITNRDPKHRMAGMGVPDWVRFKVTHAIRHDIGSDAREAEKRLHVMGTHQGYAYDGDPFLKNGNTELFSVPLM